MMAKKLESAEEDYIDLPYGGLFGNTHQIRVIKQILADPFGDYRPKELETLVEGSAPSIRRVLKNLTNLGLLIKDRRDKQHPVYAVNIDSKRYLILTLLAYAVLDDENGTNYTDDIIADYYNSELREKYESNDLTIPTLLDHELFDVNSYSKHREILIEDTIINQASTEVETYPTEFVKADKSFLNSQEPAVA